MKVSWQIVLFKSPSFLNTGIIDCRSVADPNFLFSCQDPTWMVITDPDPNWRVTVDPDPKRRIITDSDPTLQVVSDPDPSFLL